MIDSYRFSGGVSYTEYSEPDHTRFITTKVDVDSGHVTMIAKKLSWTKYLAQYLAWVLWYSHEPGIHVRRLLPDGGVEKWTLPRETPSLEH
jgi:hypothetical protein